MPEPEERYGWKTNPDYYEVPLWETVGYVEKVWVEQETGRQAIFFTLVIYTDVERDDLNRLIEPRRQKFLIYMDVNTTVAVSQHQLLRDALWSRNLAHPFLVRVHFNYKDESGEYAHPYWLELSYRTDPFPVQVAQFYEAEFGVLVRYWRTHFER